MAAPTLSQLIAKIQNQNLTRKEASDAFIVKPDPHHPFDFRIYVNPDNVDVTNLEALAKNADTLLRAVHDPAVEKTRNAPKASQKTKKTTAVAEGDSWFRLPNIVTVPNTCIDYLQDWGYPIQNLAHWGDTLGEMLLKGEFWPYVDGGFAPLMFSGGGNDVLGNGHLTDFLEQFDVDHAKPEDATYYVRDAFYLNLDDISKNVEKGLIVPMVNRHRTCKIVMHGYDYVIPRPDGPWLGTPMQFRGLDPTFNAELCRNIVRIMIDAFNLKLKALAARYPDTFIHVDLRGTVGVSEWYDELHGKNAAAQKIARKFATVLDNLGVTPEERAIARLHQPPAAA